VKVEHRLGNLLDYSISIGSEEAIHLSERIPSVDVANNIAAASQLARDLCSQIDEQISPLLNELSGTCNMRFAWALAGYKAHLQAVFYLNLAQALESCHSKLNGQVITCPNVPLNELIHSKFQLPEVVKRLLLHSVVDVEPTPVLPAFRLSLFQKFWGKIILIKNNPSRTWGRILGASHVFVIRLDALIKDRHGNKKGRILMSPPYLALHDFGAKSFEQYKLLLCSEHSFNTSKMLAGRSEFDLLAERICGQPRADGKSFLTQVVSCLLVNDIFQELAYCLWDKNYLAKLIRLRRELNAHPVSLGIWCIPPVFNFDSLAFELLMSCGVPVIGNQHGGLNGCQHHTEMMIPDLLRCTDFVSWGCSKEDIQRVFPQEQIPCRIHPLGWHRIIRSTTRQQKDFDLLFPLTNTLNMLNGGMVREKPGLLLEKQVSLLEYLDGLHDIKIAVKPFPSADQWNCGVYDRLMKLRNVEVFWDVSLVSFIEKYHFCGVIIEHPSTPLYEVLNLDVEIFLHLDSVLKIESHAFEELERRAHCFHSIGPMIQAIDNFLTGKLPRRRDEQFYRHYVSRSGTKEKIFSLMDELQNGTLGRMYCG
jgi:hypothetical protein